MRPTFIISGGQTGADQAGLRAARRLGIKTGGYAPKGYRTEVGEQRVLLMSFRLLEHETEHDYAPRTRANVEWADATVIFGKRSRGSNLTERLCGELGKPMMWITVGSLTERARFKLIFIERVKPTILNVAGNRESVNPGIGVWVEAFLVKAFEV